MSRFLRTLNSLGLYWRTLRHLKFRQIVYRLWYRFYKPKPDLRPAPMLRATGLDKIWMGCTRAPSMITADGLVLLNQSRRLQSASDWNHPDWPKLWLYNAHYFDDLNADNANQRQIWHSALIQRWIKENPPASGNGWEPYPSSLRIVNWIQWSAGDTKLSDIATHSLAVQVRWLEKNLEYHLLGNHLWANAKALCFAGVYFQGAESDHWLKKGLSLIEGELHEQILPDGGHFERSPMYHAIFLSDILDLIQMDIRFPGCLPAKLILRLKETAKRMYRWLRVMSHPDGGIAFFNDSTFGVAPDLSTLKLYAESLGLCVDELPLNSIEYMANSGFVRIQNARAVMLADVGSLGPSYIPGHAHAGTLSFEFSLDGERLIVNSGISTYEDNSERLLQRSTSAHNTVVVSGQDSSEVWSSFRVARRAKVADVSFNIVNNVISVEASHDGYRRIGVSHKRRWHLDVNDLTIEDTLLGPMKSAIAYIHHAPLANKLSLTTNGTASNHTDFWRPGFNLSKPNICTCIEFNGPQVKCNFSWA